MGGFSFPKINIPPIRLPPPVRLPEIKPVALKFPSLPPIHLPTAIKINIPPIKVQPLPPPLKIPPLKELIKQVPLIGKPLTIPPLKIPIKIDINIPGLPKVSIKDPVIKVPPLKLPPPPPPLPKPKIDMNALKMATGLIVGVLETIPITKPFVMAGMAIADVASKGKAGEFINNGNKVNGTLGMLPGGLLIQQIANDASHGKSGDTLNKFVPDPKKMITNDGIAIAKTLSTDPKNTLNTVKSVATSNVNSIKNNELVKVIAKPTIMEIAKVISLPKPPVIVAIPSLVKAVAPPVKPTIIEIAKTISLPKPPVMVLPPVVQAIKSTLAPAKTAVVSAPIPIPIKSTLAPVVPSVNQVAPVPVPVPVPVVTIPSVKPTLPASTIPMPALVPAMTLETPRVADNSGMIGGVVVLGILASIMFL
jgi:hypothetical protein